MYLAKTTTSNQFIPIAYITKLHGFNIYETVAVIHTSAFHISVNDS